MIQMWTLTALGIVAFVASYAGVAAMRRYATQHLLDIPNARSSHVHPTPRGGGLPLALIVLAGLLPLAGERAWLACWLAAALVATVSWIDDMRSLSYRVRLVAHAAAAGLVLVGAGAWPAVDLPWLARFHPSWAGFAIIFLWLIGLTNAYNFMDGIDGLAGSQAIVAGVGWLILGNLAGQPALASAGLLLACASGGFLLHNWPPARIFMGDVGSAFLGFLLAALTVLAAHQDPRLAVAGVLLVWPFLFDTFFTFFRRLRRGENVFAAHRSHLYQRLVIAGRSHRFVTVLYTNAATVGLILALIWWMGWPGADLAVLLVLPLLCFGLWFYVRHVERLPAFDRLGRTMASSE